MNHSVCATHKRHGFSIIELLFVIAIITLLAALIFPVFAKSFENGRAVACMSNQQQLGRAISMYTQDYDETFPMNRLPDSKHSSSGCIAISYSAPSVSLEGSSINWKREIKPYIKNNGVFLCPSNSYAYKIQGFNGAAGDESNVSALASDRIAASYAYNTDFFHEAVPACWYGEKEGRPRRLSEIFAPSNLIEIVESRYNYPDLGSAYLHSYAEESNTLSAFKLHNRLANFLFTDGHSKRITLASTCTGRLWTDNYPQRTNGCSKLNELLEE